MAIQTTAAPANINSVIGAFITFCVANAGFTDHGTVVIPATNGPQNLHRISRTRNAITTWWGFIYDPQLSGEQQLRCRMMNELPDAVPWLNLASGQTGRTIWGFYHNVGPFTQSTFYTDGDSAFAVVEMRPGVYTHLGVGNIQTVGTFVGGEFLSADFGRNRNLATGEYPDSLFGGGTNPHTFMLSPHTSTSSASFPGRGYLRFNRGGNDSQDFAPFGSARNAGEPEPAAATLAPSYPTVQRGRVTVVNEDAFADPFWYLVENSNNVANFRAGIYPCYIFMRDDVLDLVRTVGFIPNIGCISLENLAPQSLVNTDWRVYPRCQKDGGDRTLGIYSGKWGLTYREIP